MPTTLARKAKTARSAVPAKGKAPKYRKCRCCKKRKLTTSFEVDNRLPSGRTSRCGVCARAKIKRWKDKQPEKWHKAERLRIREAVRAYRLRKAKEAKKRQR